MPSFPQALARLSVAELTRFIKPATLELLEALGMGTVRSADLVEIALRKYAPAAFLADKAMRQMLLEALKQEEAAHICRLLRIDYEEEESPWAALIKFPFRKSDQASNHTLRIFFGVPDDAPTAQDVHLAASPAEVVPHYPLFAHQRLAAREASAYLRSERKRVLLHMPTGAGKTRTAMNIICGFLRDAVDEDSIVVWLAHTEELCEQAAQEFAKAWQWLGNRPLTIYRQFGGNVTPFEAIENGVVIGGLQLMYARSLSEQSAFLQMARKARLVIMDEAHQATAPTYQHLLHLLAPSKTAILGLSATPGRSWLDAREDMKLADFFYKQKVTLKIPGYSNPVDYLQAEGYLAKVESIPLPYDPKGNISLTPQELRALSEDMEMPASLIRKLSEDHQRNLVLLRSIRAEAEAGSKMLIFAATVDHADMLAEALQLLGFKAASVTSQTNRVKRQQLINSYKESDHIQILSNFGVLTTGFDAPRTNVAFIARPSKSVVLYSQMVGRAARGIRAGGNATCKIYTVVDQLPGFRNMAEAFTYWEDIWES